MPAPPKVHKPDASTDQNRLSPLLWLAAGFLIVAAIAYFAGIRFTLTPSIPMGFYLCTDAEPPVGRLVTFCPPEEVARYALERGYLHRGSCPGGVEPLGKYILAGPGDRIVIQPEGLQVNDTPIPNSSVHHVDQMGRELPHYAFGEHVIGPDSRFMFSGHHPRSYDSRYFGPISKSSIISTLRPLWTFD